MGERHFGTLIPAMCDTYDDGGILINPAGRGGRASGFNSTKERIAKMKEYKVPIQSLIDHIKTACDVDPWAKEMAEELLKEQEAVVRCKDCKISNVEKVFKNVPESKETVRWCELIARYVDDDWFCADGVHKEGR